MNLFLMDLDKLQVSHIEEFCQRAILEGVRVEYKRELSSASPEKQVVKAVSAFANSQGGVLIYGVGTRGATRVPDWPSAGMPAMPDFEKKLTRWCIEHISPPVVPVVGYVLNPSDPTKAFAVIRVEMSTLTPHVVGQGTRIYVRRADNSDPVDAAYQEIELLRNQRERALSLEALHLKDLKARVGLSPKPVDRSMHLLLSPEFSRDDAIPHLTLPQIMGKLQDEGVMVRNPRSYSHGLVSQDVPGWIMAVTTRGALGVGFSHLHAGCKSDDPIKLDALLSWAILAARGVKIAAEAAGSWGTYRVAYYATGYGGVAVKDPGHDSPYQPCVDSNISIEMSFDSVEARENTFDFAGRLYWQMMWAFGQVERMWSDDIILKRLLESRRGRARF